MLSTHKAYLTSTEYVSILEAPACFPYEGWVGSTPSRDVNKNTRKNATTRGKLA